MHGMACFLPSVPAVIVFITTFRFETVDFFLQLLLEGLPGDSYVVPFWVVVC